MTTKEQKHMTLLKSCFRLDCVAQEGEYLRIMEDMISLDYQSAVLLWEFLLADNEVNFTHAPYVATFADATLKVFEKVAAGRILKTITESAIIRSAVYRYSAESLCRDETGG